VVRVYADLLAGVILGQPGESRASRPRSIRELLLDLIQSSHGVDRFTVEQPDLGMTHHPIVRAEEQRIAGSVRAQASSVTNQNIRIGE
jgi:hypothetical protein